MQGSRFAAVVCAAAALTASAAQASGAPDGSPPAPDMDGMASATAAGRTATVASPPMRTRSSHALVLAFVAADGPTSGQRVIRVSGDGLRWTPLVRSDGAGGAVEVWQARATRRLHGSLVATLRAAALRASITVMAFDGAGPYVATRAAEQGHRSSPALELRPRLGSLLLAVGRSEGQRTPPAPSAGGRLVFQSWQRRRQQGGWVQLTLPTPASVARVAEMAPSQRWRMAAVAVVIPSLARAMAEELAHERTRQRAAEAAFDVAGARQPCPPPVPGFEVGVQDDPVFLGLQPAMSPTEGFELATTVFAAHLLRLNVMWGEAKLYGWGPYDQAVQMARERCWTVEMTIMPTPTYAESYLPSELSARNLDLGLLASFAHEIAARYAGEVARFGIGNEPNGGYFMLHGNTLGETISAYDAMYMAGYRAVTEADPGAQVIAGELAGDHIFTWLENVKRLPSNGVGIHPYELNEDIPQFAETVSPTPLLVTEDGVPASHPSQLAEDLHVEEVARKAGARELVFYQLSRADGNQGKWNTGIE